MRSIFWLLVTLAALFAAGCSKHVQLIEIEEQMAGSFKYIGAFYEGHNPARLSSSLLMPYLDVTGCRRRIIERAAKVGATHLVWLYDYGTSAAAMAYQCPELCGRLPEITELRLELIAPSLSIGSLLF